MPAQTVTAIMQETDKYKQKESFERMVLVPNLSCTQE